MTHGGGTPRPAGAPPAPGGTISVAGALLGPVWRSLPRRVLAAAAALGLLSAGSLRLPSGAGQGPSEGTAVLRLVALVGGLGLAFLLDDPARDTTSAVPVRRPVRTGLRLALIAPLAALWWGAALLLVPGPVRPPAGALTLEAAAVAAAALALAALSVRWCAEPGPGAATALALLVLAVAALLAPHRWSLLPDPADPNWAVAHHWWAGVLGAAAATWAACQPEPLARRRRRRDRPGPPAPDARHGVLRSPSGT